MSTSAVDLAGSTQAANSSELAPGILGYDPPNPSNLLTTNDVQALLQLRRRGIQPQ